MKDIYEIYFTNTGQTYFCGEVNSEIEAIDEVTKLGQEFPKNDYWYESICVLNDE